MDGAGAIEEEQLTVDVSRGPQGQILLKLAGELDHLSAEALTGQVEAMTDAPDTPPLVLVDLSRVEFCDSMGLRAIILAWKSIRAHGGSLTVVGMSGQVSALLERTGLAEHLNARKGLEAAG